MSIPAKKIVNVIPGVLGAGGSSLGFNGMILTNNTLLPAGAPVPFSDYKAVASFFGADSTEAEMASVYFSGFDGGTQLPTKLYFAFYDTGSGSPYFTITCTSVAALFDSGLAQVGDNPSMHVEIHRYNGHTAPIDVTLPVFDNTIPFEADFQWMNWSNAMKMTVNGVDLDDTNAGTSYVVSSAPDSFDITESPTGPGGTLYHFPVWWQDVHLSATDGVNTVVSNPFSLSLMWFYDPTDPWSVPIQGNPFSGLLPATQTFGLYAISPAASALEFSVDPTFTNNWIGTGSVITDPTVNPAQFTTVVTDESTPAGDGTVYNIHALITIPPIVVGAVTLPEQILSLSQPINGQSG